MHSRNIEGVSNLPTDRQISEQYNADTVDRAPCIVPNIKTLPTTPSLWRGR